MSSPTSLLELVNVTAPCPVPWEGMDGDARVRFCDRCQHHVFDLSALTRAEAEALIREKEGRLCVRFFRRADGRVVTRDCGRPLVNPARRLVAAVLGVGVLLLTAVLASPDGRRADPQGRRGSGFLRQTEPFRTVLEWLDPTPPPYTVGYFCLPVPPTPTAAPGKP